jgi:hypothetical protein
MADNEMSDGSEKESPETAQTDRRGQQRTKIEINRTILGTIEQDAGDEMRCHLRLMDLSEGGMKVNIDTILEPEASICLKFDLSQLGTLLEGTFESFCRVVWTKPTPGGAVTGLEFKELKNESASGLGRLLEVWSEKSSLALTRLWKPINAKVRISEDEPWSRTLFVQALSEKGFQFKSTDLLEKDLILQSRLLLNSGPVVTPAKVRWCTQTSGQAYDAGCQFVELSDEDRASINLYLKRTGHASFRK